MVFAISVSDISSGINSIVFNTNWALVQLGVVKLDVDAVGSVHVFLNLHLKVK